MRKYDLMKQILTITAAIFYSHFILAQIQYVKTLSIGNQDYAQTSITTSDSGIVIVSFDYNNFNSIISKVNKTGMLDWSETTEPWIQISTSTQNHNNVFLAGVKYYTGYVLAIDGSGQKLWSREVTSPNSLNSYVADITSDSNNLFLLIGSQPFISLGDSSTYTTLCQMDWAGNINWQKTYDIPGYPKKLIYNTFSQKLLFSINSSIYYAPPVRVVETDLSGNVTWAKSYPEFITNVAYKPSPGYVYTGVDYSTDHSFVCLTNQTGSIYLKREFWDTAYAYDPTTFSLFVSMAGSIYIGTYTSSPATAPPAALIKLDQFGNLLLSNSYFGYSAQETGIRTISSNLQGGLYLTGTRPFQTFNETTFCMCSDTTGNAGCDVYPLQLFDSTSIVTDIAINVQTQVIPVTMNALTDLLSLAPINQSFDCTTAIQMVNLPLVRLSLFPNPTTGQVSINVDLSEAQTGSMELFDLTGRKVANWQLIGGQSVYTFDASFLPAGTYIYRIMTAGEILRTDRLIIMKQD